MVLMQQRSKKKPSGGKYKKTVISKRRHALGRAPAMTRLDEEKQVQKVKSIGGKTKSRLLLANKVNVYNPKTKAYKVAAIKTILESPANANFVRRNIMTKGTIIDTELGKARITSRPGQGTHINAVLV